MMNEQKLMSLLQRITIDKFSFFTSVVLSISCWLLTANVILLRNKNII